MLFLCLLGYHIFFPLYQAKHVIINYGISPFDICIEQPTIWKYCKYWFMFTYVFASFFISNMTFNLFEKTSCKFPNKNTKRKIHSKKKKSKNPKVSYSLIEPKPPDEKLKLLIR